MTRLIFIGNWPHIKHQLEQMEGSKPLSTNWDSRIDRHADWLAVKLNSMKPIGKVQ